MAEPLEWQEVVMMAAPGFLFVILVLMFAAAYAYGEDDVAK